MAFAVARFAANGYHPTSVAHIVEGLGVGKGVFYWYFKSKDDLFRAILRDGYADLRAAQRAAIGSATDPIERIERGLRATMAWSAAHQDLYRLFQFAASDDRFVDDLRKGDKAARDDAVRHLRDAMAKGLVPEGDPVLLAHAMAGVTTHLVQRHLLDRGPDVVDAAVAFCLHGVLGRPA